MSASSVHTLCVDSLMQHSTNVCSDLYLLGRALSVVWCTAHGTLRDTTLAAIFQRVFTNANRKFRVLEGLRLEPSEGCFQRVAAGPELSASLDELRPAILFLLVELLSVLGTLTAEVLTPTIHTELARLGAAGAVGGATVQNGENEGATS